MRYAHNHYPKRGGYISGCLCDHPEEQEPRYDCSEPEEDAMFFVFYCAIAILAICLAIASRT